VALASEGYDVTAVDLDAAMLARASRRAAAAGPEVELRLELVLDDVVGLELPASRRPVADPVEGDPDRDPATADPDRSGGADDVGRSEGGGPRRFGLAFIALNSILLLPSREAQRAAWRALAAHLGPRGIAAVDAWLPDAHDLARYDGRLHLEYHRADPETGRWVTKTAAAQHDAATQTVALTTIYEEGDPGQPACRWIRRDVVRLVTAGELRTMAEAAGLQVERVAGGYDLEPLGPHDDRAIVIARLPGTGGRE
jgi:SAM-dependent methyltransferase